MTSRPSATRSWRSSMRSSLYPSLRARARAVRRMSCLRASSSCARRRSAHRQCRRIQLRRHLIPSNAPPTISEGRHVMKHRYSLILAVAVAAGVAACASTPQQIDELETARAVVPQVEASPRAGVAVTNITEARKALDRANALAEKHGKVADIRYEATVAARNAQIANERILTAQARDDVEKGTAERQSVLAEARELEAQRNAQQARAATAQAQSAEERAKSLERELADLKGKK